ncbi:hypothetical protein F5146DRAFT_1222776 [Armillaria mellea]|nr:hypothetical protein F5146DRAFT_1222776 [Armillaria mellea]
MTDPSTPLCTLLLSAISRCYKTRQPPPDRVIYQTSPRLRILLKSANIYLSLRRFSQILHTFAHPPMNRRDDIADTIVYNVFRESFYSTEFSVEPLDVTFVYLPRQHFSLGFMLILRHNNYTLKDALGEWKTYGTFTFTYASSSSFSAGVEQWSLF